MSVPVSTYTKAYSTNDVLIGFIDNCKQSLDKNKYVGFQKLLFTNLRNIFGRHRMSVIFLSRSAARRLMCTNVS